MTNGDWEDDGCRPTCHCVARRRRSCCCNSPAAAVLKRRNAMTHYHYIKKKKKLLLQGDRKSTCMLLLLLCRNVECNGTFPLLHQPIILFVSLSVLATRGVKGDKKQEIKLGVRKCATNFIAETASAAITAVILLLSLYLKSDLCELVFNTLVVSQKNAMKQREIWLS